MLPMGSVRSTPAGANASGEGPPDGRGAQCEAGVAAEDGVDGRAPGLDQAAVPLGPLSEPDSVWAGAVRRGWALRQS